MSTDDKTLEDMMRWAQEPYVLAPPSEQNFVEITRIPKKIEANAIRSIIISATNVEPKSVEICFISDTMEPSAIVEFASQQVTFMAIERMRKSSFTKNWAMKIIEDPKFVNPTCGDLFNKCSSKN